MSRRGPDELIAPRDQALGALGLAIDHHEIHVLVGHREGIVPSAPDNPENTVIALRVALLSSDLHIEFSLPSGVVLTPGRIREVLACRSLDVNSNKKVER